MQLALVSVNVAEPRVIGTVNGEPVLSGIAKRPVVTDKVFVGRTNIAGDAQADLSVHGGVDKAVYAYPSSHFPWWEKEHGLSCVPATFGENLTLEAGDEDAVAIGDRFRWGEAILEISQPRAPCFKLALHTKRPDVPQLMVHSARSGWYLRVIEEGWAPLKDARLERIAQSSGPSVRETFLALFDRKMNRSSRFRVLGNPALAAAWRHGIAAKIDASPPDSPGEM